MGKIKLPPDFEDLSQEMKMTFYRGMILQAITLLEATTEEIIAAFYCGHNQERKTAFIYYVLNKNYLTLGSKIEMLRFILEHYYPTEYDTKLLNKYEKMTTLRNRMAHEKYFRTSIHNKDNVGNPHIYHYSIDDKEFKVHNLELTTEYVTEKIETIREVNTYLGTTLSKMTSENPV